MLRIYPPRKSEADNSQVIRGMKKYWHVLIALIVFVPLGLLTKGNAYGEWSGNELKSKIGFIPEGMTRLSDKWKALLPHYSIPGWDSNFINSSLGYIFCAIVALVIILTITSVISFLSKRKNTNQNMS